MKATRYYQVSNIQLFIMGILIALIVTALLAINSAVKDYLQLPIVTMAGDKCVSVASVKNGEAFTCGDVGTILRNYRTSKSQ